MGIDPTGLATNVGGQLVVQVLTSGAHWLKERYQGPRKSALEKADANSREFVEKLANHIRAVEHAHPELKETIDAALDDPGFSELLRQAFLSAAQTDSPEKHDLLARLVSERLKVASESTFALATKRACDTIGYLNDRQLMILGLSALLHIIRPKLPQQLTASDFQAFMERWLAQRLSAYGDLQFTPIDLIHLESLGCLKYLNFAGGSLQAQLQVAGREDLKFDQAGFGQTSLGTKIFSLWENDGLRGVFLTSIGTLIGTYVADMLSDGRTELDAAWQ